jgi:hypothetical protein
LPKDKTLQYNSRFSKLTGISHSIIIIEFPLGLSKPIQRKKELIARGSLWQKSVLISPFPETYHYPFNSTTIPLLNNKKEFYREGLGTIWISDRTGGKTLKEKPL